MYAYILVIVSFLAFIAFWAYVDHQCRKMKAEWDEVGKLANESLDMLKEQLIQRLKQNNNPIDVLKERMIKRFEQNNNLHVK